MTVRDRLVSRLRDILDYGSRARTIVAGREFEALNVLEVEALCYIVLIITEATTQALRLDAGLEKRYPDVPWEQIRGTGNRLRHGYASLDRSIVHDVVARREVDVLVDLAHAELARLGESLP